MRRSLASVEGRQSDFRAGRGWGTRRRMFLSLSIIDLEDRVLRTSWFWPAVNFTLSPHIVIHPVGQWQQHPCQADIALEVGAFETDYIRYNAGGCEDLDFELQELAKYPIRCVPQHHVDIASMKATCQRRLRMARGHHHGHRAPFARNAAAVAVLQDAGAAKAYEIRSTT